MNPKINYSFAVVGCFIGLTILSAIGKNNMLYSSDEQSQNITNRIAPIDSPKLKYPLHDTQNSVDEPNNPIDLKDPSNIKDSISYDPETNEYILIKTIGNDFYRDPYYMSFGDFLQYEYKKQQEEYFEDKGNSDNILTKRGVIPPVNVNNLLLNRLFGSDEVDIRPQGNIELTFGGNFTNIQNPSLTVQQRKQGGFNFDMNIQMNVVGKIGDKLKLTTNYNTQAQFDFEKQVKLEYTGHSDEIIKKIEAGNVSLPLTTQLIQGSQSLFGIKTQLQFGRLKVTALASQQKSQTQNITVQGGQQTQTFNIPADQYDENRNFFLGHFFHDEFNDNMAKTPTLSTPYNITRVEIWVTNRTGATVNVREIDAFMDLGESKPYNSHIKGTTSTLPYAFSQETSLNSNNLYYNLTHFGAPSPPARSLNNSVSTITQPPFDLVQGVDFEQTYARLLAPTEYTLQPQLGYIMLNTQLNPDDVLAIAYQYTYEGKVYQVGEFSTDISPNPTVANVLFVKLLKGTTVNPKLPIWQLEMKNVYSLGGYGITQQNFILNLVYLDPAGGARQYIPAAPLNGITLLSLLGLDRLNSQNDPQPDGIFDFIPNYTINPQNGKVIFPVLEPFGQALTKAFNGSPNASNYVYQQLYDSTKTVALQFPQFDRFYLQGQYQSSTSSDISLGAFNIPQGSVTVTAGGTTLQENVDYTIDYNLGRLKIINAAILASGVPINVKFENNPAFVLTQKTLLASRFDYFVSDNFKLGATVEHLSERPFTQLLNVGSDPISNTVLGIDGNYKTDAPWLTKLIDKLPLINTKEKSSITLSGEGAALEPGHPKIIGKNGTVYIDDFEGTESTYDLKFPFTSWSLASTPSDFPESKLINNLAYGFNRAHFQWYNIDPFFYTTSAPNEINGVEDQQYGVYTRQIFQTDLFPTAPSLDQNGLPPVLTTFDIQYDPTMRGPYNYRTANLNPTTGALLTPQGSWGGIMRSLDYTDFEAANIGYIEFWLLSPYINNAQPATESDPALYVEIGNISEDILKDSRLFYENALPTDGSHTGLDSSVWSFFPANGEPPIVPGAFDNDPTTRQYQDVGYDGISDVRERFRYSGHDGPANAPTTPHYLDNLAQALQGQTANAAYKQAYNDPSGDDYLYYRDASYDAVNALIIARYASYNGPEGNSPITSASQTLSFAETNIPNTEDINGDNSLNQVEAYFEYKLSLKKSDLVSGQNFITDVVTTPAKDANGNTYQYMIWYQVKIPINSYIAQTGGIQDFTSIRFMRIFLTGFTQPITLRFGELELLRNQWRSYNFTLAEPGEYLPDENSVNTFFDVTSVSYETDGQRQPVDYVLPPGVQQQQAIGTVTNYLQNETSLAADVCDLVDGDARAAYKEINLDLRNYDSLKCFCHAESVIGQPALNNTSITGFIRLGSDFTENYYEYEIPLQITPAGIYSNSSVSDQLKVWPAANNFAIKLTDLTSLKVQRNQAKNASVTLPYTITINGINITIVGNPDLGLVKVAMLGIRNPAKSKARPFDNGQPVCADVWFDELRVSGFNEQGGYAALARMDVKLADLGNLTLSGNMHTIGYGSVDQTLDQRALDNFYQYNTALTLELGRFIPKAIGLKIPMYLGYTASISDPKYDPYELDVTLKETLSLATTTAERDSIRRNAQTFTSIKSLNFTNVRRVNPKKTSKLRIYSLENLSFTYAYTQTLSTNPTVQSDLTDKTHVEMGYAFPGKAKYITPFTKLLSHQNGKYWKLIKDFNFNLLPTNLSFRTQFDRQYNENILRPIDPGDMLFPTYDKYFTTDRFYAAKLDLTKSLNIDFSATTNARIDEPYGSIDTREEKDSIIHNLENFGRTVHYHQGVNVSYTLPFSKIPILDWTSITAKYSATYDWLALPQILDTTFADSAHTIIKRIRQVDNPLGNTLSNTRNISVNGDFNIRNLYGKWKWLKRYDTNVAAAKKPDNKKNAKTKDKQPDAKPDLKNNVPAAPPPSFQAFLLRLAISLKKVNFSYTDNRGTSIPGFVYMPNALGENFSSTAPGFNYIFGMQPDTNWLKNAAKKGWITKDTSLNYQFIQTMNKSLTMRASFEPARDFNVDINFSETYSANSSAIFKNTSTDPNNASFQFLSPQQSGTFTISYIAIKTIFVPTNNGFSAVFNNFSNYREIISARWQKLNPNSKGIFTNPNDTTGTGTVNPNYAAGYGPYSQDVLIPAFIAAYTGQDPNKVRLSNFMDMIPYPNWRITYNGLNKIDWFKKYVNNVSLTHAYTSSLSFGSYSSDLLYMGKSVGGTNIPMRIDSSSGNFIPFYDIQSVSISERFAPLIGIDISWKGGLTTKLDYGIGRNVSLSMLNVQLTETKTTDLTFNIGYKWKKFPIPFKIRGKKRRLKNDINLSLQLGYNKNETDDYQLIPSQPAVPTQGNTVIQISPAIDYQASKQLTVRFFVDKRFSTPSTSASYPINYTSAGVKIRFTLQ